MNRPCLCGLLTAMLSVDGEAGMQQLEAHLYLSLEGEGLSRELR